jgi:hypothetical protein
MKDKTVSVQEQYAGLSAKIKRLVDTRRKLLETGAVADADYILSRIRELRRQRRLLTRRNSHMFGGTASAGFVKVKAGLFI